MNIAEEYGGQVEGNEVDFGSRSQRRRREGRRTLGWKKNIKVEEAMEMSELMDG
jgi:hypothetical protein